MDVNGKKGPNKEVTDNKYFDIRAFKSASFSGALEHGSAGYINFIGTNYEPLNCVKTSPDYGGDYYCGPFVSNMADDYWAGAKKECEKIVDAYINKDESKSSNIRRIK